MRLFPVLIDARPAYLGTGQGPRSLLLTPVGSGTLLEHLHVGFRTISPHPVTVLTVFEPDEAYERALRQSRVAIERVLPIRAFVERVHDHQPSDWFLIRDARRVSAAPLDIEDIVGDLGNDSRWVRHVVTLAATVAGTSEFVILDPAGRVSRIQRYYESVTWPFASGVACSLLPVASTLMAHELPFSSLRDLRAALSARGVPSRDLFLQAAVFDLTEERGLLALTEQLVFDAERERAPLVSPSAEIHATALLKGPVIVGDGAVIGPNAIIIGPTLIGAGSRVGANAVVAQCLVPPESLVPAGSAVRHRYVAEAGAEERTPRGRPTPFSPGGWGVTGEYRNERPTRRYADVKAPFEAVLALLGLLAITPLLVVLTILVKLDSRGPILFGDRREGKGGRVFRCWKFRTMFVGADARQRELAQKNQMDGPQFKMDRDPRVTHLGRILRPLSLDEFPQLFNVLFGEMSFVGPRPSPFRENQMCIPWREARLSVRPGITGLWQVCRQERSMGDFHQWIYYDLLYVRNMSTWLDLKILLATLFTAGGKWHVPLHWVLSRAQFEQQAPGAPQPPRAVQAASRRAA
jgi:lipopolysaccharide/colanic/teichoic acid biosynthesis glycosyltransferase